MALRILTTSDPIRRAPKLLFRFFGVLFGLAMALVVISEPAEAHDVVSDITTTAPALQSGTDQAPVDESQGPATDTPLAPEEPSVTEPPVTEPPTTEAPAPLSPEPAAPSDEDLGKVPPVSSEESSEPIPQPEPEASVAPAPVDNGPVISVTRDDENVYLSKSAPAEDEARNPLTGQAGAVQAVVRAEPVAAVVGETLPSISSKKTNAVFTLRGGDVPPGAVLRSDGTFAGAPSEPGRYQFQASACDISGCEVIQLDYVVAAAVAEDGGSSTPWILVGGLLATLGAISFYRVQTSIR